MGKSLVFVNQKDLQTKVFGEALAHGQQQLNITGG